MNSSKAKQYGNLVKTDGVNQSNINGKKLLSYPIPICSIAEQKEVQFLSGLSLSAFKTSLEEEAGSYLGNDSGPSHLAAMLGIPTEVLFISTNPEVWKPLGPRVKLLRA